MPRSESNPHAVLARNIERLMKSRGLNTAVLADESGIEQVRIEEILGCSREADAEDLLRLAGVFDVEPGALLSEVAWEADEEGGGGFRS